MIDKVDRHKTAFITRYGLFEHTRMGMGLCNAPATFQRAMQLVLRGLTWSQVLVYLDDVVVLGSSFENSLENLREAFDRFRLHNLKLKPRKCTLFQKKVEFLGKVVSSAGISVSPTKTEAVAKWPIPSTQTELLSFLGFLNYHRDHIKDYATICADLYDLAQQKGDVAWTDRHHLAFDRAKEALVSAPCLSYPRPEGLFILDTDASDKTIGAVLSQVQDGQEKVICYASHVLLKPQRRYCTTRKELLSVVKFCRHFRHYLLGRRFLLRTDHNSLVWLMRFKHIEGQLARWLEELAQYNMEIIHRPGKKHTNADGMSRLRDEILECDCYHAGSDPSSLPCGGCHYCRRAHTQWGRFAEDVDDVVPLSTKPSLPAGPVLAIRTLEANCSESRDVESHTCNWAASFTPTDVRQMQKEDTDLRPIIDWLDNNREPSQAELTLQSPATRALWMTSKCLRMIDNVLHYKWDNKVNRGLCLIVPKQLQALVLKGCHDYKTSGHLGQQKTLERLKQNYMWYNMSRDCIAYVQSCGTCNQNKRPHVRP